MPTVNKIRAGFAVCDNCGAKSRTIGWALTERLQMGYQGLGSVHLCPACLASEREALVALPAFVEELKDTLRAHGVDFSASARREDLQALVDALPFEAETPSTRSASTASTTTATADPPTPTGNNDPNPYATDALMASTRDALVEQAMALGLQKPPENATKAEIVKRIQTKAGEAI